MDGKIRSEPEDMRSVDGENQPAQPRAYHRHFEGYSEVAVSGGRGKGTRIERVYTGLYYCQDLSPRRRILIRLLYVALFLAAVMLFVSSAVVPLASNSTWYVNLCQAACVAFLFWILVVFYFYLPAKRAMTIAEYRSSSLTLPRAAMGSAVSFGALALANVLFIALHPSLEPLREFAGAARYLVAGLLSLAISRVEGRVNYVQVPSQQQPPSNSVDIS